MPVAREFQEQVLSALRKGNECVGKLPAASDVAGSAFDFAQKLRDEQRKFVARP